MTLLNIHNRIVTNADNSTSVFDQSGNLLEVTEADGTALIYAHSAAAPGAVALPLWYGPAPSASLQSLMSGGGDFQTLMDGVSVYKMYASALMLPDATLKAFFAYLSQHNIKLAIEGAALVSTPGGAGDGTEGFAHAGDLTAMLQRIKTLGGTVAYVGWDEPYYYGHVVTGLAISGLASEAAVAAKAVAAVFPNAKIGDLEPVGLSTADIAGIQSWFTAYASATGAPLNFFQADISGWVPGWQTSLAAVFSEARSDGLQVGAIIDGVGSPTATDAAWSTQAVSMGEQVLSDPRLRPDYVVVQSWETNPGEAPSPSVAGTLASVAEDVTTGMSGALSVPAAAQYDATGIPRSVSWSGGWTAAQDGKNLTFTSPTGAVVRQFAWSTVRVLALNPDTGALKLSVSSGGQTSAYAVTVSGGQFVFASSGSIASAATTTTLTVTLAAASETGAAGSGVTDQTKPTLAGTAAPNATVQIQIDSASPVTVAASSSGAWTYTVGTPLGAGAHLIAASVAATSGAASQQSSYVVSVDPTQRLQSSLTLAAGSDSGYPGDQITDVTRPTFSGVDDPNTTIAVAIDGKNVGTATADATGAWTYASTASLALGVHHVAVTASGPPGTSPAPATMQFLVDTAAQEAAAVSSDPLFDAAWYRWKYPQTASSSLDPYTQYMTSGWKQGYDPSPFFSTSYYLAQNADVAAAGINPLMHFEHNGWQEGRNPSSSFNTMAYEAAHPGLAAGQDPLVAYINSLRS